MVDPIVLGLDIVADSVSLALPAALWAVLFLLAWEHTPFAESIGFGRWAFWLLLPGALLASLALLPIAPVSYDWVAVSLAGAIFPLIVGALAFGRAAPPLGRSFARYLAFLTVEAATLFVLVLPASGPLVSSLGVGGTGAAGGMIVAVALASIVWALVALVLFARGPPADPSRPGSGSGRVVGFSLALTTAVLASTFAATAAIPGVGIVEQFPEYLMPPIGAGLVAAALAPRIFPGREAYALPTAYLTTTFGVLLGADLLRQPPLYGTGPAGLYTIGGAGVLDLVYLSGLLALGTALLGHLAAGRRFTPVDGGTGATVPTPLGLLALSFREGVRGELGASLGHADAAAREAALQAHRLLDLPPPPTERPWQGLPVPGWVVADQANLDAVSRAGTTDVREGFRAWLTARWLVNIGRELGIRRFGSVGARAAAFVLDLAIVILPAVAIWFALALTIPGDLDALLSNVGYNAAIYGFVAIAFLYLVLVETVTGTSPGKRLVGLAVRDRHMQVPAFSSALVRNVSILPVLTVVALGGAIAVAFSLKVSSLGNVSIDGVALPAGLFALGIVVGVVIGGVALLSALGALLIVLTSERQRLGDVWAGTWVVRDRPVVLSPSPLAAAPAPAPPAPPGPTRSS